MTIKAINRRDFAKYISSIPFFGSLLSKELLASNQSENFVLIDELENIVTKVNKAINDCHAFRLFNIINLDIAELRIFQLEDKVGYLIPNHGHKAKRVSGVSLFPEIYQIAGSIDWQIESRDSYFHKGINLFVAGFVKKINNDAFTLLKYSGMDNLEPNWNKITDIYGTECALLRVNNIKFNLSDNCNIHLVDDDNGLNDNEIVGLDLSQKNKLFITIREKIQVWNDPVLNIKKREGIYGWMELGYSNISKNISYHIKL